MGVSSKGTPSPARARQGVAMNAIATASPPTEGNPRCGAFAIASSLRCGGTINITFPLGNTNTRSARSARARAAGTGESNHSPFGSRLTIVSIAWRIFA